jgi:hypothetical protein
MTAKTTTISIDFDQETINQVFSYSAQNNTSISELVKMSMLKIINEKVNSNLKKPNFQKFFASYKAPANTFQNMTDDEMSEYIKNVKLSEYETK